jgi:hypothetical protein
MLLESSNYRFGKISSYYNEKLPYLQFILQTKH